MDDLLGEFLTETSENLDVVDAELVKFERDPNDKAILDNIFRLVHTIKGTCGFLGLPRLEAVAHAAETMLGKFRDGELPVTPAAVTLILESLDHIKSLLAHLGEKGVEPEGDDRELIGRLERAANGEFETAEGNAAEATPDAAEAEPEAKIDEECAEVEAGPKAMGDGECAEADAEAHGESHEDAAAAKAEPEPAVAEPHAGETAGVAPASASEAKPAEPPRQTQSIRVNVDVLENLMTMVSELVLTRNQLLQMVRNTDDSEFKVPLQRLSNVTAELQDAVMKTRMQPIGNAWQKLPRIVRDVSQEIGKKINLVMNGQDTELDRQVLELIKDPLTHMVRNSADHGVEMPEIRKARGKPETGTINLRAFHEGGHIIIEIADDGAGLNTEKIKHKALANGLATEAELASMTENQIQKFIFAPGFSTAQNVTNLSGRGVGMDVVRTNIELIGGQIDLWSEMGKGTTLTIKIPLTLAIVSALIVEARQCRFAIPQLAVIELVRTGHGSDHKIETINEARVLRLRDRLLPLMDLSVLLGEARTLDMKESHFVVVMQVGSQRFGIIVDNVFDTEEIVVKPVASVLRDISMFSGNTILGDGSVIMIIDPNGVANAVAQVKDEAAQDEYAAEQAARATGGEATSLLLFRAGSNEPKAAPLSLITRLEEIDVEKIEPANGANLIQYRGKLMPLVHAAKDARFLDEGRQPILVFSNGDRLVGVAVDEIVDIVEEKLNVELVADEPGVLGSAVIKGRATQVVDVMHYLDRVFADWFGEDASNDDVATKRLLVIDENDFFRNMVKPILSVAGYQVTTTESVEAALKLLRHGGPFDLILVDGDAEDEAPATLAAALKDDASLAATPVLTTLSRTDKNSKGVGGRVISKSDREGLILAIQNTVNKSGEAA